MRVAVRLPRPLAPGLSRMVTASAAAHLLLAVAAMVIPGLIPRPAPPRWDSVMLGTLVELPAGGGQPAPAETAPAAAERTAPPPEPQPAPAETVPPPPVKKKKAVPKSAPPEPQPTPSARPAAKPQGTRPAATAGKAVTGDAGSGDREAPAGPGGDTGATPAGAGIGLSIGGGSFGHAYYAGLVRNKLQASYRPPVHPGGSDATLAVRVSFRLDRQGRVADVAVEIPSPYPALDSAALRAVYRAAPFPPLPPAYTGETVDLAVTFTLEPVSL